MDYLLIDNSCKITQLSGSLDHPFCSYFLHPAKKGEDIRLCLPELIGLEETIEEIITGKQPYFVLKGISRQEKDHNWYFNLKLSSPYPLFSATSNHPEVLVLLEDATEEMNTSQYLTQVAKDYSLVIDQLSHAKDYISKIVQNMNDMLIVTDDQGLIKSVNPATLTHLEYPESLLIGKPLKSFCYQATLLQLPLTEEMEIQFLTKTEKILDISLKCSRLPRESYHSPDYIYVGRDITGKKQEERQMKLLLHRDQLLGMITRQIRQSLELKTILETTVTIIRQVFDSDRVLIYQLQSENDNIQVEALAPNTPSLIAKNYNLPPAWETLSETDFWEGFIGILEQDQNDPNNGWQTWLYHYGIKTCVMIPILLSNNGYEPSLWGFLMIHQYHYSRLWEDWEIDLLKQFSEQLSIAIQQAQLYQQVQSLAISDGLTQLANRRYFNQYLIQEWQRHIREQNPIALILCDIDYFKQYNDTHGHLEGDRCLKAVSQCLQQAIQRPSDLVARYGGEEFAVILPNTDPEGALIVGHRLQQVMTSANIPHGRSNLSPYVTISLGVSCVIPSIHSPSEILIDLADQALYQAKKQGRNQLVFRDC